MKRIFLTLLILLSLSAFTQDKKTKTALILIDIQNFYYPSGAAELHKPLEAGLKAKTILEYFRESGQLVVHIRHNFEPGGEIHNDVAPIDGEKVISKDEVNSFKNTNLLEYLKKNEITNLVLVGMQTHMCLEAATRAAHDYDFNCTVIEDACTTRDLKFGDKIVKAEDVHYSTLATLKSYAIITNSSEFLEGK